MTEPILRAEDLAKFYMVGTGVRALRRVSMHVGRGEFLAITGPSGCGKSTLLSLLGGLDRPTHGEVWLENRPYSSMTEDELAGLRREHVGFVFQFFNLLPDLNALENVALPLRLQDHETGEAHRRAHELLDSVGLDHRWRHRPHELSGGEQQRVAIARALAGSPSVVLADEPTGNLDTASTRILMGLLAKLNGEGQTIVVISHDPDVVSFANRVLIMEDGIIAREEQPAS